MERLEEYVEEESPVTELGNLPRDPILEDLSTNSSELLQTVKDLKSKMESVKRENERILRAREELNQILTERFQTEGKGRRIKSEDTSHQHNFKKMKHTKNESSSSSEVFVNNVNSILLVIVVMTIITLKRGNTNPMRKFLGNSKR